MKPFQNILVGLDVDPRSDQITRGGLAAANVALWLAKVSGAKVDFVHSSAGNHYAEREGRTYVVVHEGLSPKVQQEVDKLLTQFTTAGIDCQFRIRDEAPWMAVIQQALESQSDVVLIGKHDKQEPGPKLGGVAIKVIRKCPSAVWLVDPDSKVVPESILAATDLSEVGKQVLQSAGFVAKRAGAKMHVAHSFQISMEDQMSGALDEGRFDKIRQRAIDEVKQQVASATLEVEPKLHVACTSPIRELLALEKGLAADLVVIGSISRAGLPGLLIGSTAEKVLPQVSCSLLTIKPAGFVSPVTKNAS